MYLLRHLNQSFTTLIESMDNIDNNNNSNSNNSGSSFIVSNLLTESEDAIKKDFKKCICEILNTSYGLHQSSFFIYVKMLCYLIEKNKTFQDFVNILEDSIEAHVQSFKTALKGVSGIRRSVLVANHKRESFDLSLATGKQVLSFFEKVVSKTYKKDPTYLHLNYMYPDQVRAIDHVLESFECPVKNLAQNSSYFRYRIDHRLGLRKVPIEVYNLISADLPETLVSPIDVEEDLETKVLTFVQNQTLLKKLSQPKIDAFVELKTDYIYSISSEEESTSVSPRKSIRVLNTPTKNAVQSSSTSSSSKKRKSSVRSTAVRKAQSPVVKKAQPDSDTDDSDNEDSIEKAQPPSVKKAQTPSSPPIHSDVEDNEAISSEHSGNTSKKIADSSDDSKEPTMQMKDSSDDDKEPIVDKQSDTGAIASEHSGDTSKKIADSSDDSKEPSEEPTSMQIDDDKEPTTMQMKDNCDDSKEPSSMQIADRSDYDKEPTTMQMKDSSDDSKEPSKEPTTMQIADSSDDEKEPIVDKQSDTGAIASDQSDKGVSNIAKQFTENTKIQMAKVLTSREDFLHFGTEILKFIEAQNSSASEIGLISSLFKKLVSVDGRIENVKEGHQIISGKTDGGRIEASSRSYPLIEVLSKLQMSVCSWTIPANEQIKGLQYFSSIAGSQIFGIYVRAFSLFIFPSKIPHPLADSAKSQLFKLSFDHKTAANVMPALDSLHHRLGTIELPTDSTLLLDSIRNQIQAAIDNGTLKFSAAEANSPLYRLDSSILFSILLQKPQGRISSQLSDYNIPLSFPVTIQEKVFVLQTVAANYGQNGKSTTMQKTICRATFNYGGYFLTTQTENEHTIEALLPNKSQQPIKSKVKIGRDTHDLEELFFVENFSQSFTKPCFMLEDEIVFEIPSLSFVSATDLRNFYEKTGEYLECNILEVVYDLLKKRIDILPIPERRKARNILFPAQFFSILVSVNTLEELHQNENTQFHLSQYDWTLDTIAHLTLFHPTTHWQYCSLVFAQKKVYCNDSNMAGADTDGRNLQIKKLLSFVEEFTGFTSADWEFVECMVPQQTENPLHFCGTYVIINLLRAYVEALSEHPFQQAPSWEGTSGGTVDTVATIPTPIMNVAKQLMVDAILGRRDLFDIFYLLLPHNKLSRERRDRGAALFLEVKWTAFKPKAAKEKSLNLVSEPDLIFFEKS